MKAIQFKKIATQRKSIAKKEEVDDSDSGIEIVSVDLKAHAHARTGRRQVEESGNRKRKMAMRPKPEPQKSGNAESVLSSAQTSRRNPTGEILTPPSESELLDTVSTRVRFNSREGRVGSAVVSEPDGTQPVPVEDILKDDIFSGEPYFGEPERTDDEIRQLIHGSTNPVTSNFLVNTLVEFSGGNDITDGQSQILGNSGLNQLLTPMSNTPRKRYRGDNEDYEESVADTDTNGTSEDSEEDDRDADENAKLEVPTPAPKRRRMAVEDHRDPGPLSNKVAMEANDGVVTRAKVARRGMPPGTGERTGSMFREQHTISDGKTSVNNESNTNRNNTAPRSPVPSYTGMIIEAPESCLRCQLRGTKCLYVNSLLPGSRGPGGPTFKRSACAACAQRHEKCEWNVERRASGSQNRLDQVRADVKKMIEEERVRLEEIQVRLETLESTLEVLEETVTKP